MSEGLTLLSLITDLSKRQQFRSVAAWLHLGVGRDGVSLTAI
ncbi:MAG: hypothetical protein RLY17_46 [Pseudomonadota bacterium]|jgi:hypothetical protein